MSLGRHGEADPWRQPDACRQQVTILSSGHEPGKETPNLDFRHSLKGEASFSYTRLCPRVPSTEATQ